MKFLESERAAILAMRRGDDGGARINEDHALQRAELLLLDASGGTFEDGVSFVTRLMYKITEGIPFSHSMIVYGEKFRDRLAGDYNIRAVDTPFNRGLVEKFEIDIPPNEITGDSIVTLGSIGMRAQMEPVWDPDASFENGGLTSEEKDGLRRHLYDSDGNVIPDSGVTYMPKVALRAHLLED